MTLNTSSPGPVIVIGASAGGVGAILELAPALPRDFPAPILFVQHIGAHRSELYKLVSARGPNAAVSASEGDRPRPGTIYIAPPDQHMLLDGHVIRLTRDPKEHHARPAIDPLFRSAALDCGPRAIGVVLTGMLDDGSAGLRAIKDCGGTAVVQDPADAHAPSMPRSALACVDVDHVVPLAALGPLLFRLASRPAVADAMEGLRNIGSPPAFTCPDCGGVLFELNDKRPARLRCRTGHGLSLRSLAYLQEKQAVLRRLAQAQESAMPNIARDTDALAALRRAIHKLTKSAPRPDRFD